MADGNEGSGSKSNLNNNGDRVIGGSVRVDGSVRKTLKVRPGFTPAEEVKKYDVKERMKQRQDERLKEGEKSKKDGRKPGSRPNRQFGAINNILQSAVRQAKSASTAAKTESGREQQAHNDINSLAGGIDKLEVSKKSTQAPVKEMNEPSSASETEDKKLEAKPRKYIPPSRRNK